MPPEDGVGAATLADYLRVLRRRKWVVIETVVLVPAVAVLLSALQPATYLASAQVLLNQQNSASDLFTGGQTAYVDPARAAQTQADLARVLEVTNDVVATAKVPGLTTEEFLKASTVTASPGSDFLTFAVKYTDADQADRLATNYATAYVDYRHRLDREQVTEARRIAERRKRDLEASGLQGTLAYQNLVQALAAMDNFETQKLVVLHRSDQAVQVGPHVARNGALALVLGLVLGVVFAFIWDVLDSRVRSVDRIRKGLDGLRLLGRIPEPPRHLRKSDRLVMIDAPTSDEAEPFRVLRVNFDLVMSKSRARTVMVTSAVGNEGKSTTVGNLAVALARAGRRVVLIDADLRNPSLHRFFRVPESPGLVDVATLHIDVRDAVATVALDGSAPTESAQGRDGTLEIIAAGPPLADPDQVSVELAVARIVEEVRERVDFVLVDAGPLLPTGDAIALSTYVDAMLLVVRLNVLSPSTLDDLQAALMSAPAVKLGFVLTDAEAAPHRQSQHSGAYRRRPEERREGEDTNGAPAAEAGQEAWAARSNGVSGSARLGERTT